MSLEYHRRPYLGHQARQNHLGHYQQHPLPHRCHCLLDCQCHHRHLHPGRYSVYRQYHRRHHPYCLRCYPSGRRCLGQDNQVFLRCRCLVVRCRSGRQSLDYHLHYLQYRHRRYLVHPQRRRCPHLRHLSRHFLLNQIRNHYQNPSPESQAVRRCRYLLDLYLFLHWMEFQYRGLVYRRQCHRRWHLFRRLQ